MQHNTTGGEPRPKVVSKLYALLVGITDYSFVRLANNTVRFPALTGCTDDTQKIKKYLSEQPFQETHIKCLLNTEATKPAIVQLFSDHLGRAGENDQIVFYYSGHGTQEYADEVFQSDTDKKLESIVCYYDAGNKDDCLLSDKELRYLIHSVSARRPRILTLFDCCHSAGIVRNALRIDTFKLVEKRIPYVFAKRNWEQFIFSSRLSREDVAALGEMTAIPEADFIHLSACESNESAVEYDGEGVFTKYLLKVLSSETRGLTYETLHNRIRQYLRGSFDQTPRLIYSNRTSRLRNAGFLGMPIESRGFAEVSYHEKDGWQLSAGALHGATIGELAFYDADNSGLAFRASITHVYTDHSLLLIEGDPDKTKIYHSDPQQFLHSAVRIFAEAQSDKVDGTDDILDILNAVPPGIMQVADEEKDADFTLRCRDGQYYFSRPFDPARPLVKPTKKDSVDVRQVVEVYIEHLSKWKFLYQLENADATNTLPKDCVQVAVAAGMPLEEMPAGSEKNLRINYVNKGGALTNQIAITLKNTSTSDLYCCTLYLTSQFQCFTGFLDPPVYHLEPGEEVSLKVSGKKELEIQASEMVRWYNWPEVTDKLKLIASTALFSIAGFDMDPLPEPDEPGMRSAAVREGLVEKGIVTRPRVLPVGAWSAMDYMITFVNPDFKEAESPRKTLSHHILIN